MSAVTFTLPNFFLTPPATTQDWSAAASGSAFFLERPNSVTVDRVSADRIDSLVKACQAAIREGWIERAAAASTYRMAKAFLDAIPVTYRSPEIAAHPDGEIEFEWFTGPHRVLTISIGPSGAINYAGLVNDEGPIQGREAFAGTIPPTVAEAMATLALSPRRHRS